MQEQYSWYPVLTSIMRMHEDNPNLETPDQTSLSICDSKQFTPSTVPNLLKNGADHGLFAADRSASTGTMHACTCIQESRKMFLKNWSSDELRIIISIETSQHTITIWVAVLRKRKLSRTIATHDTIGCYPVITWSSPYLDQKGLGPTARGQTPHPEPETNANSLGWAPAGLKGQALAAARSPPFPGCGSERELNFSLRFRGRLGK